MGVRRFVNLLVANRPRGIYSLRCFDLSRNQFFYPTLEEVASHGQVLPIQRDVVGSSSLQKANGNGKSKKQLAASEVGTIRLPAASLINMRPASCPTAKCDDLKLDAFPLLERNILFADRHGRVLSYDADAHCLVTMPSLHAPKEMPLAFSFPGPGGEQDGEGRIYIIESMLYPERSSQFEALVSHYRTSKLHNPWSAWQCRTLPPPPLGEQGSKPVSICSSAVVGNVICISVSGLGTYCFDTASHSWSHAGDWILPFFGAAEYVPELNLWFGVSPTGGRHDFPCAADLSPVVRGQPPEPAMVWGDYMPEEWHQSGQSPSRLVSLGSGRFCIIRLLESRIPSDSDFVFVDQAYAVFTGLEVLPGNGSGNSNGKHRLRMIRHKTRRCRNVDTNFIVCVLRSLYDSSFDLSVPQY